MELRNKIDGGQTLDDILPEAFAAAREASEERSARGILMSSFWAGSFCIKGKSPRCGPARGKTLVATLPAYLNAISGQGVHVVTVNDYLSRRDAVWMGQIYNNAGVDCRLYQP